MPWILHLGRVIGRGRGLSRGTDEHSCSSLCPEHLSQPALSISNFFAYPKWQIEFGSCSLLCMMSCASWSSHGPFSTIYWVICLCNRLGWKSQNHVWEGCWCLWSLQKKLESLVDDVYNEGRRIISYLNSAPRQNLESIDISPLDSKTQTPTKSIWWKHWHVPVVGITTNKRLTGSLGGNLGVAWAWVGVGVMSLSILGKLRGGLGRVGDHDVTEHPAQ